MKLHDVIQINSQPTSAAIILEKGVADNTLVGHYTPTQASIQVFEHLCRAVLPQATQEQRALNIYGSYGAGKSHLAVVLAQLLSNSAKSEGFSKLLSRLEQAGQVKLAQTMRNTFLPKEDKESRPYLLVSLYASNTTSLGEKLMEGLYDALNREPDIDIKKVLPSTEYDVCVEQFESILKKDPKLSGEDLSQYEINDYLFTEDLLLHLKDHSPSALKAFLKWHKGVCHVPFNVSQAGGKNFIGAYLDAGKNLAEKYHFGGIVVLWDEFGHALEDMIGNSARNAGQEIMALQEFVEGVCTPRLGHTLFFGVTHVSFQEYGDRTNASNVVKDGLSKISGRFNKSFKIELNPAESDGYHLLGMQKTWSEKGRDLLVQEQNCKHNLLEVCNRLPIFQTLNGHLDQVFDDVYPLHPLMAVGLFNLSKLAQANRTALTFFRKNASEILNSELTEHQLWKQELVRLPKLLHYYADSIKKEAGADWKKYEQALANVNGENAGDVKARKDILSVLLLAKLLGENFQASEGFLACALYDATPNTQASEPLNQHLSWLKAAGLIWKNTANHFWTLAGEGGVDTEALIKKNVEQFSGRSHEYLLSLSPSMQADLLPTIREHDLEPSESGIVRSFSVDVLQPYYSEKDIKSKNTLYSVQVYLLLAETKDDVRMAKGRIANMAEPNVFFWIPIQGIKAENYVENDQSYCLNDLMCRYLAINEQLKQSSVLSEDLRRQLEAKWESNRQAIKKMLQMLYGRAGLECGNSEIYRAGTADALNCNSWHGFKEYLTQFVRGLYPNELAVRAMNMNVLRDEKYTGSRKIVKIVDKILGFNDNPGYQTDLLGENETSELASLTDGVLGANQLFIERPSGWDIRTVDETEGNLKEVLKLLHDGFVRKRDKPYEISQLRNKLVVEPYGLPSCTLPMFAAVAIRHEVKRLKWGNTANENDFSKNLVNSFKKNSRLTIRLFEFSTKQVAILSYIGKYLDLLQEDGQSDEEYASGCVSELRLFIRSKPEGLRSSSKLDSKTQKLINFSSKPGKSPQDMADFLIELLSVKHFLHDRNIGEINKAIYAVLDDFTKIEDSKLHGVMEDWDKFFPVEQTQRDLIVQGLRQNGTRRANQLLDLLEKSQTARDVAPREVVHKMSGKPFDDCSDTDIGKCMGYIESLIEQANKPVPVIQKRNKNEGVTPQDLKEEIKTAVNKSGLTKDKVVNLLEKLLSEYKG